MVRHLKEGKIRVNPSNSCSKKKKLFLMFFLFGL